MLYGPPGTGKTSYIAGLARALGRSVYYVDFSTLVDQKASYLRRIKPNSFLVLEDIDTIPSFRVRDDKAPDQKDLGKLLKILDGVQLPDNTVIFATTNYIDRIDPAVKRFGRFDLHFELEYADKELATEMVNYIDPSKIDLVEGFTFPISQAEIQARVLKSAKGAAYEKPLEELVVNEEEEKDEDDDSKIKLGQPITLRQVDKMIAQRQGKIRRLRRLKR
jgi:ATP-dependent 26S proteasome regulatory subunit